jgi:hypothetical protein
MNEAGGAECQAQSSHNFSGGFSGTISPVMPNDDNHEATSELPTALPAQPTPPPREVGGREGPEPTRFGDWELRGRCIDF